MDTLQSVPKTSWRFQGNVEAGSRSFAKRQKDSCPKNSKENMRNKLILLPILFCICACQTISTYDEHAYALQTSCLADILKLLDVADTPYENNLDQIKAVTLNAERAYEYDRNRPLNQIQVKQWGIIRDPNQGSFAGFLAHWKAKGQLNETYIGEKKKQIGIQFDAMTGLEAGKIH